VVHGISIQREGADVIEEFISKKILNHLIDKDFSFNLLSPEYPNHQKFLIFGRSNTT